MKIKNTKTGEIATLTLSSDGEELLLMKDNEMITRDVKLSDLDEWEDYEEPKEYWYIDCDGEVYSSDRLINFDLDRMVNIGNRFDTREEAEKALERLHAWKRLKDKGFKFGKWFTRVEGGIQINMGYPKYDGIHVEDRADLDLLFGGEE